MEVKVIGQMDNTIDHTFESANRVYGVGGISPTIPTCGGGGIQPKILEVKRIGVIACFAMACSENFGLKPNKGGTCKTLKASTHDIAILERVCREQNVMQ